MRREYIFIRHLIWFFFLLYFEHLYVNTEDLTDEYSKGCAHLRCENGSRCIRRRFWCKNPPCPGMLYCSKSRKESLKGPLTCDTVRCSRGYVCMVKVRDCHWDEECKQQIARCVSEKEYYEGAASCAGFKCPSEKRCILREIYCVNLPCKLIRSCVNATDAEIWFDECRKLNCTSKYECFLRRPGNNCRDSWCAHTPDCTLTVEDELINKHCHGWICPRSQKCVVRITGFCKGFDCTVERSCRAFVISSVQPDANTNNKVIEQPPIIRTLIQMESELTRQELERKNNSQMSFPITGKKPTLTTSTRTSSLRHTTPTKHDTEILLTHRQAVTTRSNIITKSFKSTLPYPQSWWNYNKLSTNNITETTSKFADLSSATFPTNLLVEERTESTTSRDMKQLEIQKEIYIASKDALSFPMVLEGINFIRQNYPIWIKNSYRTVLLEIKDDENGDAWGYHAPQEPYKILLPPYEPVILIEDTRERGQFFPFFTYPFNKAAVLISLPEITSIDTTVASKDNILTMVDNKIGTHINDSATIIAKNSKTNYFDDLSGYYTNFPAMEKRNITSPNIYRTDNYYDVSTLQGIRHIVFSVRLENWCNNDLLHYTRAIQDYVANDNLATFNSSVTTGQSDYSSRDEKLYGLANYPYDIISVDDIDKSEREYEGSPLNKILNISLNEEGNQSDIPFAFPFDKADKETNV
ncbi:uncharacterized protein LOC105254826 [Camponotus floridanus]|uniref:uncharacterized protein LOC105254826 n=1 Tax=Camponotus floridanus TaxID=104421 RepID=UPI0009715EE5|nr:uncharacterized protein LOC105254826 [Camponotus floridanus]